VSKGHAKLAIAVAALGSLGAWVLPGDGSEPVPADAPATVPPAAPAAPPLPAAGTVERAATEPVAEDRSRQLELPDGSFVPALNGAVDAAGLAHFWGPMPWSPIVGVDRSSAGVDWYRHEDGSYSTTQMVWRSDLGRHAAMTRVAHPGPAPAAPAVAKR
jgi:hypothetical protein